MGRCNKIMLCLHYYSNYVTLRIQEDDGEYSLDQIKEFEEVYQPWSEIVEECGEPGTSRCAYCLDRLSQGFCFGKEYD